MCAGYGAPGVGSEEVNLATSLDLCYSSLSLLSITKVMFRQSLFKIKPHFKFFGPSIHKHIFKYMYIHKTVVSLGKELSSESY